MKKYQLQRSKKSKFQSNLRFNYARHTVCLKIFNAVLMSPFHASTTTQSPNFYQGNCFIKITANSARPRLSLFICGYMRLFLLLAKPAFSCWLFALFYRFVFFFPSQLFSLEKSLSKLMIS